MSSPRMILGVTRLDDDPQGPASGLIFRDGDKLRWEAVATLELDEAASPPAYFRLVPATGGLAQEGLARVEFTVSRVPRFLFRGSAGGPHAPGKLHHQDLRDKLLFSEAKKALLKPQKLQKPLPWPTLVVEYLEVCRLSDLANRDLLSGERAWTQLAEVLGVPAKDPAVSETLWELARQRWVDVHDFGDPKENAVALKNPAPAWKGAK